MKEGPDIALLGSLIGDPARANMLTALMSGMALTARELSVEAGITAQTASTHHRGIATQYLDSYLKGFHLTGIQLNPSPRACLNAALGLA